MLYVFFNFMIEAYRYTQCVAIWVVHDVGADVSVQCFEPDLSHSNCSWWFIHNCEIFCSQYQSNQLCLFTS